MPEEENKEEEKKYDLRIPPGTPNMETLLAEVIQKFGLKLIAPKDLDDPYYLAVRGDLESVRAAKEYIREKLEQRVAAMEKKMENSN